MWRLLTQENVVLIQDLTWWIAVCIALTQLADFSPRNR
jgi:hypothetical protein